jgi:hypothetical protein
MNRCCALVIVAAIAHVHVHFNNFIADQVIHLFHLRGQCVTIIGIPSKALCAYEPTSKTVHRNTDLVAELILLVCIALGDAFNFRLVRRVDLVLVMPLLRADLMRCREHFL